MTVVFDAGQNSEDNFAHLAGTGLHYIGSVPACDCPDLTALPASARTVDKDRFGGLTAFDTRREVYGARAPRHPDPLPGAARQPGPRVRRHHAGQGRPELDELAATLARGKTRRGQDKVGPRSRPSPRKPWVRRVITWQLAGDQPRDLRLTWHVDQQARAALEEEIFGKHVLITSHDDWPVPEVVAGYRSQSEAEFSFRQMKDPHVVSFSPMHHWTEHNIRVHIFTCVLALQIAHLMRLPGPPGPGCACPSANCSRELAGIGETVLLYHGEAAGPAPTACSPTPPRSRTSSPNLQPRPLHPHADMGNTPETAPSTIAEPAETIKRTP